MDVSIVIATYDRAEALHACLNSIGEAVARTPDVATELIIVTNASPNHTPDVAKAWAAQAAFPVRVLSEPRPGACRARNLGIREAKGRLIVMTDDDCCLSDTYLHDVTRAHAADVTPSVRGGRLELGDPDDCPITIKTATDLQVLTEKVFPGGFLIGCNLSFPKPLIDRIGYFDESFGPGTPVGAAEDTDFLFRAREAGVPVIYDPSFVIYHHHGRRRIEDARRLNEVYNRADGAFYAKHLLHSPNLLRFIYRDVRDAVLELAGGRPAQQELGFSHWTRLAQTARGALAFVRARPSEAA